MSEKAPGKQNQLLHMRYFIVHLHRLLDPKSAGRTVR
jgi:Domain of unknown function (DUF4170)